MAIQYNGSSIVNATFTGDSIANIITALETHLVSAGHTVVSGSGSTDVKFQSALTAEGNRYRLRVYNAGGTCVRLRISNVSETLTQPVGCYLLPAGAKTFRIIASRYWFVILVPGSVAARDFVMGGALFIPSFLNTGGSPLTTAVYIQGSGMADASTSIAPSFRTHLCGRGGGTGNTAQGYFISNSTAWENDNLVDNTAGNTGGVGLIQKTFAHTASGSGIPTGYRYHDDASSVITPEMAWGLTARTDEPKIKGIQYDAFLSTDSVPMDQTTTYDGYTWYCLTSSNDGGFGNGQSLRGSLMVRIS